MPLGRNDPCHCGSGKKYKRCHLDADREAAREAARAVQEALPALKAQAENALETERRLREEYGVYVNYVSPVEWQGRKVWAIGTRLYLDRRPSETFHEFILDVLKATFGEDWAAEQAALPEVDQHFVFRLNQEYAKWSQANLDPETLERDGVLSGVPNGWVQYFLSLAWDVVSLIHSSNLPDRLVARLRDPREFQGARYEIAIAAIFARLDCEIRFLDEDEELRGRKHVEFIARHRPTGQEIAVETKSRRREGVLNEPGEPDPDDPLHGDPRAVRRRFMEALEQAPEGMPFVVFIDINAPLEPEAAALEKEWIEDIRRWMARFPIPTAEEPSAYNALYVTNFAPHYDGDDLARPGEWLAVKPLFAANPLRFDLTGMLDTALNRYHQVPAFTENGEILG
jgi:SEC-C motif